MNIPVGDELPEAANQKEIEKRLKVMLGPPPQEATETTEELAKNDAQADVMEASMETEPTSAPLIEESESVPEEMASNSGQRPKAEIEDDTADEEDDATTSEAVDAIVAEEGDKVLAADDADVSKSFQPEKTSFKNQLQNFFKAWWNNHYARYGTLAVVLMAIIIALVLPVSRYFLMNLVTIRASARVTVLDESSQQPLKNVQISLGGENSLTGSDGIARIGHIKLGKTKLLIQKRAYGVITKQVTIGWGSNPLGSQSLKVIGSQYVVIVKDFLSGKPIENAEASSGDANASSDKDGKILLAVEPGEDTQITVTVSAKSYRDEKLTFKLDSKADQSISMVPARKEAFVSKRSGKYDVYKIDVDGKNEVVVLKGTGFEQDAIALLPHPTDEVAALVSTRDGVRNSDGFLLSTLTLINLGDNSSKSLGSTERIRLVGWLDSRLVYVQIAAGASAANSKRYRLTSYDYKSGDKRDIASANYFNDVRIANGSIYYAISSGNSSSGGVNLTRSNGDGSSKQVIISQEVWNIFRVSYEDLKVVAGQNWYAYKLGNLTATKLDGSPVTPTNRIYMDSGDKLHSLWVDNRDGKGVLISYDTSSKTDKILKNQSGLDDSSLRWLSNSTLIYRIHTDQETADYVLNINGGEAKKITDVTNTSGIEKGYFY
jgi:hypothetical protein